MSGQREQISLLRTLCGQDGRAPDTRVSLLMRELNILDHQTNSHDS
jgi:hypothetical protein